MIWAVAIYGLAGLLVGLNARAMGGVPIAWASVSGALWPLSLLVSWYVATTGKRLSPEDEA